MSLLALPPDSEEFGQIEVLLQVQLNSPQLRVTSAVDLTNPSTHLQYVSFCQTLPRENAAIAFVPAHAFPQKPSEIIASGLKFDASSGLRVTLGAFPIDRSAEIIEALQLRIAFGVPQNHQLLDQSTSSRAVFLDDAPKRSDLRAGFHSICMSPHSEYVVFNRAQVECLALVRFRGGDNLAESTEEDSLCDVCRRAEAAIWCVNCCAKLCAECDASSHAVNAVLARHERLPLVDARALREFCPEHARGRFEYYCRTCHQSLCTRCKMAGSHARGAAAQHDLVPIRDAYADAVAQMQRGDRAIARRRAACVAKRAELDAMLGAVLLNLAQTETELLGIAEEAIRQERDVAGDKALVIRSVQTELRRKLGDVEALERSLRDHRRRSGPQTFLRAATTQARIVGALQTNLDLPLDVTTQGDVFYHGNGLLDAVLVRSRRSSRARSRGAERVSFAGVEKEVIELNRWIRSILPEFIDLRTEFESGVPLIALLRVIQPDRRPLLAYPIVPANAEECQEARAAAVHFAKELGVRGTYDESILMVRGDDPAPIVRFLRSIQRDIAGVSRETSAGISSRRAVRIQNRDRAASPTPQ